ncbi:MAG: prephenate dehydrogenase/arogenate dehydrogenase family protein [Betaproteobacteria bacterium]|nr:prephenate dehydrogenase/arogenate dehydrogenase family protein [Betaproteobacteria bacterium]MBI2961794.1 prephenate dehydrogenase/arogenate dehydrogenase family protein [Betaproteobacteria bacterium]
MFGVGLIGGSFALALKSAGAVRRVVGVGRTAGSISRALALGVIDEAGKDAGAARGADLVLLAMPVGQTREVMRALAPHLEEPTVVTDAGSTKRDVVQHAETELGGALARFVPAHPIAGAEHSGVDAASATLYQGRTVVLTPLPQTSERAAALVEQAWEACGAQVQRMAPREHDEVFAAVSHLPHLLAFALVDLVAGHANAGRLFEHAASGFRDFTRIASSHPEMWRDICMSNRDALLAELSGYEAELAQLRAILDRGDAGALQAVFERARAARNRWLESLK